MSTTTWFIEEIVDDDDNDDDDNNCESKVDGSTTSISNSNSIDGKSHISAASKSNEVHKDTPNPKGIPKLPIPTLNTSASFQKLKACPHPIGGGVSLTILNGKAYIFGGCNRDGIPTNTLHIYDLETDEWNCHVQCSGTNPSARFGHVAFAHKSHLYIFAGQGFPVEDKNEDKSGEGVRELEKKDAVNLICSSDLYCLNTISMTWEKIKQQNENGDETCAQSWPAGRNSHSLVQISCRDDNDNSNANTLKLCMFGGANLDGPLNDTWTCSLNDNGQTKTCTWKQLQKKKGAEEPIGPCSREMHSACFDAKSNRMYVVGGRKEDGSVCQDMWAYSFDNDNWLELASPISPRCAHITGLVHNRYVHVFGGWDGQVTIFNNGMSYDTLTNEWKTPLYVPSKGAEEMECRFAHAASVISNREMIITGGVNPSSDLSDFTKLIFAED